MNNKSKTVSIAAIAAAVALFNFQSCKKYEDGPLISLKTKKGRLTGEWELVGGNVYNPNQDIIFEFEKDGDFTLDSKFCFNYNGTPYCYSSLIQGDWEWENQKEEIEITYNNGSKTEYEILKLTNKELILEDIYNNEWEFEKQ